MQVKHPAKQLKTDHRKNLQSFSFYIRKFFSNTGCRVGGDPKS